MGNVSKKHKLSLSEISSIKNRTKLDERTILEMFEEFNKLNPSGKMKLTNLLQIYEDFFPDKNCKQLCRHIFRVLDMDHNGYVDFTEFCISISVLFRGSIEDQIRVRIKVLNF